MVGLNKAVEILLSSFSDLGVTLTNVDISTSPPTYWIQIKEDRFSEETLRVVYSSLWILTYGKISEENRDEKIILNYTKVGDTLEDH